MNTSGAVVPLQGFGCVVLAHDLKPNAQCEEMGVQYMSLEELLQRSDVVSLHCPLLPSTKHMISADRYHQLWLLLVLLLPAFRMHTQCHAYCFATHYNRHNRTLIAKMMGQQSNLSAELCVAHDSWAVKQM